MSPNPRLTGDLRTDAETALEDLRVVRGWLLDAERLYGLPTARHMWRALETARDVLKTMVIQEGGTNANG